MRRKIKRQLIALIISSMFIVSIGTFEIFFLLSQFKTENSQFGPFESDINQVKNRMGKVMDFIGDNKHLIDAMVEIGVLKSKSELLSYEPWMNKDNFERIKEGMKEAEVIGFLGQPTRREIISENEILLLYQGKVNEEKIVGGVVSIMDGVVFDFGAFK